MDKSLAFNDNCMLKSAELNNCTFVKTVLMIIVVLYHCIIFWTGTWLVETPVYSSGLLKVLSQWLNSFHIYGFALVSGYLFYFSKYEKKSYNKFIPFIINKTKRLLVPYVFIALVWVIPISSVLFGFSIENILNNFVLGCAPQQLWFLLMLFNVFVIFYPLSNFFKKHTIWGFIIVLMVYRLGYVGRSHLLDIFQIFRAFSYFPLFWLGFKIRQYNPKYLNKVPVIIWFLVDIVLFIMIEHFAGINNISCPLLMRTLRLILHIIGALMIFYSLQKLANKVDWESNKFFKLLSRSSMIIYLLHQQIVYIFVLGLNGLINPYIHALINFVGVMPICLLICTVMLRFKVTRFLVGEKIIIDKT